MTQHTVAIPAVRKSVVVGVSAQQAFDVFTQRPMDWWPPNHILLRQPRVAIRFERGVGGRYYEIDVAGNEAVWGVITTWDPPQRLHMTWRVDGRWQPLADDTSASDIEVTFTPLNAGTTRVELAHLNLERVGETAQALFAALDGPSPGDTLTRFCQAV